MAGTALFLGKVGATGGTSTGPHAHWEVMRDGKRFPLSKTRKDIGQYLQFRLPNQQDWQSLYSSEAQGFKLNPAARITSPMGQRAAPSPGASTDHKGEDYSFPEGTMLRFLGQGSVSTNAGVGTAGNVSALRTGPYELQTFHLSELPVASTTRQSDAEIPGASSTADTRTDDILKAFMYGVQSNKKQEQEAPSFQETLKGQLVSGLVSQALNPSGFLSAFRTGNPFLSGQSAATSDYLSGIFG